MFVSLFEPSNNILTTHGEHNWKKKTACEYHIIMMTLNCMIKKVQILLTFTIYTFFWRKWYFSHFSFRLFLSISLLSFFLFALSTLTVVSLSLSYSLFLLNQWRQRSFQLISSNICPFIFLSLSYFKSAWVITLSPKQLWYFFYSVFVSFLIRWTGKKAVHTVKWLPLNIIF